MEKIRIEWIGVNGEREIKRMSFEHKISDDFLFVSTVFEALTTWVTRIVYAYRSAKDGDETTIH